VGPYCHAQSAGKEVEALRWAILLWLAPQSVGGMVLVLTFLDKFLTSDPPCGFKQNTSGRQPLGLAAFDFKGPVKRARVPHISFPQIPLI
jgi:hypothetical protein